MQQQCHIPNTIFDYPRPDSSIHFFMRESITILETATGELERKMKMAIQCSSIITLMFRLNVQGFFIALRHSGLRHGPGETGKTLQKGRFCYRFPENSGNKVEFGIVFICSQIIVLNFVYSMFLEHYKLIIFLVSVSASSKMSLINRISIFLHLPKFATENSTIIFLGAHLPY